MNIPMSSPIHYYRGTDPDVLHFENLSALMLYSLTTHFGSFRIVNGKKTEIAFVEYRDQVKHIDLDLGNGERIQDSITIEKRIFPLRNQADWNKLFEYILDLFDVRDVDKIETLEYEYQTMVANIKALPKTNIEIPDYDLLLDLNEYVLVTADEDHFVNGAAE
jgi:hypothetical protein